MSLPSRRAPALCPQQSPGQNVLQPWDSEPGLHSSQHQPWSLLPVWGSPESLSGSHAPTPVVLTLGLRFSLSLLGLWILQLHQEQRGSACQVRAGPLELDVGHQLIQAGQVLRLTEVLRVAVPPGTEEGAEGTRGSRRSAQQSQTPSAHTLPHPCDSGFWAEETRPCLQVGIEWPMCDRLLPASRQAPEMGRGGPAWLCSFLLWLNSHSSPDAQEPRQFCSLLKAMSLTSAL